MSVVYRHVGDSQLDGDGGAIEGDECIDSSSPELWRLDGDNLLMTDRLTNRLTTGLLSLLKTANLVVDSTEPDGGVKLGVDLGRGWCREQVVRWCGHRADGRIYMRHLCRSML